MTHSELLTNIAPPLRRSDIVQAKTPRRLERKAIGMFLFVLDARLGLLFPLHQTFLFKKDPSPTIGNASGLVLLFAGQERIERVGIDSTEGPAKVSLGNAVERQEGFGFLDYFLARIIDLVFSQIFRRFKGNNAIHQSLGVRRLLFLGRRRPIATSNRLRLALFGLIAQGFQKTRRRPIRFILARIPRILVLLGFMNLLSEWVLTPS